MEFLTEFLAVPRDSSNDQVTSRELGYSLHPEGV